MTDSATTTVHFSCSHCRETYVARQEHRAGTGYFNCEGCGKPVHQWSGPYTFTGWTKV
jgi:predicted RNA-binding Zn-ribbon protein involved in translation (DUF1610 family)